jgi:hypothetical protein
MSATASHPVEGISVPPIWNPGLQAKCAGQNTNSITGVPLHLHLWATRGPAQKMQIGEAAILTHLGTAWPSRVRICDSRGP